MQAVLSLKLNAAETEIYLFNSVFPLQTSMSFPPDLVYFYLLSSTFRYWFSGFLVVWFDLVLGPDFAAIFYVDGSWVVIQ